MLYFHPNIVALHKFNITLISIELWVLSGSLNYIVNYFSEVANKTLEYVFQVFLPKTFMFNSVLLVVCYKHLLNWLAISVIKSYLNVIFFLSPILSVYTVFFLFSFLLFYLMLFQFINGLSLIFSLLLPCSDIFSNKAIRAVGCTAQ